MREPVQIPPPGFDDLPVDEKISYVQSLWDRIAAETNQLPLHEWQLELIKERLAAHERSPDASRPWDEAIARVEARLRKTRRQ